MTGYEVQFLDAAVPMSPTGLIDSIGTSTLGIVAVVVVILAVALVVVIKNARR